MFSFLYENKKVYRLLQTDLRNYWFVEVIYDFYGPLNKNQLKKKNLNLFKSI